MFIMKLLKGLVITPLLFLGACSSGTEVITPEPTVQETVPESEPAVLPEYSMTEDERSAFCGAIQDTIDLRGTVDWSQKPSPDKSPSEFALKFLEIQDVAPEPHRGMWATLAEINEKNERLDPTVTPEERSTSISYVLALRPMVKENCNSTLP